LRRAEPAVGARAHRLVQSAGEARARGSDGARLAAAAAATSRRPADRRPARAARGAAARAAAVRRGPRGRRRGGGGHPCDRAGGRAVTSEDHSSAAARGPAFTVLMPLWRGDRADRLELALRTATLEQELRPVLLILTWDGALPAELEAVVDRVEQGEFGPSLVLRHEAHRGVAAALQDGLEASPHDLVARADADDICRPERFARQIPRMDEDGLDLLGSSMREFSDTVTPGTGPLRTRPLQHEQIVRYLPHHSPFHHPSAGLLGARSRRNGPARDAPPPHQAAPARADRALPPPPRPLPPAHGGAAPLGGARGGRLSGSRPAGGLLAVGADDAGRRSDGEPARGAGGLPRRRGAVRPAGRVAPVRQRRPAAAQDAAGPRPDPSGVPAQPRAARRLPLRARLGAPVRLPPLRGARRVRPEPWMRADTSPPAPCPSSRASVRFGYCDQVPGGPSARFERTTSVDS